jgi:hypothetical protein
MYLCSFFWFLKVDPPTHSSIPLAGGKITQQILFWGKKLRMGVPESLPFVKEF